jgi:lysosomal Pro-X carboxypeptidase
MYANIAMVDYPYPTSFLADLPAFPARIFCSNVTSPLIKQLNTDEEIVKRIVKGTNVFFNYTGHTECFDTGSEGKSQTMKCFILKFEIFRYTKSRYIRMVISILY